MSNLDYKTYYEFYYDMLHDITDHLSSISHVTLDDISLLKIQSSQKHAPAQEKFVRNALGWKRSKSAGDSEDSFGKTIEHKYASRNYYKKGFTLSFPQIFRTKSIPDEYLIIEYDKFEIAAVYLILNKDLLSLFKNILTPAHNDNSNELRITIDSGGVEYAKLQNYKRNDLLDKIKSYKCPKNKLKI